MDSSITVIVFSKDRAWQLSECLRTLYEASNKPLAVTVLFKISNEDFRRSYDALQERFEGVTWVEEENFAAQLQTVVDDANPYILMCCDDSLYYNKFDAGEAMQILEKNNHVCAYHIMLHGGLSFCHPQGKPSQPPPLMPAGGSSCTYVRMMGELEWNYPWELSSSLYRKADVEAMLVSIVEHHGVEGLAHPNKLENTGELVVHNQQCESFMRQMCACSNGPVASAVVINRVQDVFENPVYDCNEEVDVGTLDKLFWEGRRFDVSHYQNAKFNAMHIGEFALES